MKKMILNNGYEMPQIGLGTFKMQVADNETFNAVNKGIELGYRHIDCAAIYGNEIEVGKAIKASNIDRSELFITSKLWNTEQGYESTKAAFAKSCEDLQVDYLDLYLIHWPVTLNKTLESWRALEELYLEGKIKAIGVCNFTFRHLSEMLPHIKIMPMVNQIELHPQFPQNRTVDFCKRFNIHVTAWGSLMQGQIFNNEIIAQIAAKHNVTISQVALQWAMDRNLIVIPKSVSPNRLVENLKWNDFKLDDEDLASIDKLNTARRIGPDPDEKTF